MKTWQQIIRDSFRDTDALADYLDYPIKNQFQPLFIPRPLAKKIKETGPTMALWKQFVPDQQEALSFGMIDPIGDLKPGPLPYFIHRYKNRALFFPTEICPVQCRYCFRKNHLHNQELNLKPDFEKIGVYLADHPEINEIIFSGGDPFMLTENKIDQALNFFSTFSNIKYIRFHTRAPSVLPERINGELIDLFRFYEKRWRLTIVVHLNHPMEISPAVEEALRTLSPFHTLTQSVLLKDINDNTEDLYQLFNRLIALGIRPYYLHHPDQVKGGMHFTLPQEEGQIIMHELRQQLPGWALPHYVIDTPNAQGKKTIGASSLTAGVANNNISKIQMRG